MLEQSNDGPTILHWSQSVGKNKILTIQPPESTGLKSSSLPQNFKFDLHIEYSFAIWPIEDLSMISPPKNVKVGLLKCYLLFATITKHSRLFLLNRH